MYFQEDDPTTVEFLAGKAAEIVYNKATETIPGKAHCLTIGAKLCSYRLYEVAVYMNYLLFCHPASSPPTSSPPTSSPPDTV